MRGWDLVVAGFRFQGAMVCAAETHGGLSGLGAKAFVALALVPELRFPAAIAEALSAPPNTVSNILRDLEARGYVRRESMSDDRRRLAVTLTPAGEAALHAGIGEVDAAFTRAAERLSSEEQETLRAAERILSQLAADGSSAG